MGRETWCAALGGLGLAGGASLLTCAEIATPDGGLAGALSPQQRSALVALACPDLPPSALSGRLHLQAQQRARSALGRHERACASGYRPHLRAAATARAVLAAGAGLEPDVTREWRERQAAERLQEDHDNWERLHKAAQLYTACCQAYVTSGDKGTHEGMRPVGKALEALVAAMTYLDSRAVASSLWACPPATAAEAEMRQHTPACGAVACPRLGGAPAPAWLLAREAPRMLPARAALLLHGHMVLAAPAVKYSDLIRIEGCMDLLPGRDAEHGTEPLPAGRTTRGHQAAAAALAEGLVTYWGTRGSGGGPTDTAGLHGALQALPPPPGPYPLLCSDLSVLANVVAAAQTLSLIGTVSAADAHAAAESALAAVTRPAVLLRVARVLSSELLCRVPPDEAQGMSREVLRIHFVDNLADALSKLGPARRDAAAFHSRDSDATTLDSTACGQAAVEQLRPVYCSRQDEARRGMRARVAAVAAAWKRLLGSAAAEAPAAGSEAAARAAAGVRGGKAKGPGGSLRSQAVDVCQQLQYGQRLEAALHAGLRLTEAIFEAPWPAAGAPPSPVTGATAGAAVAPLMCPGVACQAAPPPEENLQRPPVAVMTSEADCAALLFAARRGYDADPIKAHAKQLVGYAWAAYQSTTFAALARAMVGALAPCWEAAAAAKCSEASAAAQGCSGSPPSPHRRHSPSPSSLVLQGAPAICYSLARTAAVNYVLDRVARGLAAAAAAAQVESDRQHVETDAVAIAVADRMQQLLPQFQRACGGPLVMTLGPSTAEETAGGAAPAAAEAERTAGGELVWQLPEIVDGLDVAALMRRDARLVAAWAAQLPEPARQSQQLPAAGEAACRSLPEEAEAAAAARPLHVAVAEIVANSPSLLFTGERGSSRAVVEAAIKTVESMSQQHPLRSALLHPADGQSTTAAAVALAEHSHRLRSGAAAAPRELVVVPLLDEAALGDPQDGDTAGGQLEGLAALVLHDLTQIVSLQGSRGGCQAQEQAQQQTQEDQPQLSARIPDGGAAAVNASRQPQADWQFRLPLALSRAVCRLAGLPTAYVGWAPSDLSQQPSMKSVLCSRLATLDCAGKQLDDGVVGERIAEAEVAQDVLDAEQHAVVMSAMEFVASLLESKAAASNEGPLEQLCEALYSLLYACRTKGEGDGVDASGDPEVVYNQLQVPLDPLRLLVADAAAGGGGEQVLTKTQDEGRKDEVGGRLARPEHRQPRQALQLLVAEAAPGQPTVLLGGTHGAIGASGIRELKSVMRASLAAILHAAGGGSCGVVAGAEGGYSGPSPT